MMMGFQYRRGFSFFKAPLLKKKCTASAEALWPWVEDLHGSVVLDPNFPPEWVASADRPGRVAWRADGGGFKRAPFVQKESGSLLVGG